MQDVRLSEDTGLGRLSSGLGHHDLRLYPDDSLRGVSYNPPLFPKRQVGILVNTWAEVPPMAAFPTRARNGVTFEATGAHAQEAWSLAQEPRRYVSAKQQLDVVDSSSGVAWTAALASSPASWVISEHRHLVDNNEALFWLKIGVKKIAEGRPWHGYFDVPKGTYADTGSGAGSGAALSSDVGYDKTHVIAYLNRDGIVKIAIEDHALNQIATYDLGFVATAVHIKMDRQRQPYRIRLYTVESGSVYVRQSTDGGRTFSAGTLIGTGTRVTADVAIDGIEYVYRYSAGAILGRRYDRDLAALEAEFTAIAAADDAGIAATAFPVSGGKHRIVLRYVVGSVQTAKQSYDGITFF